VRFLAKAVAVVIVAVRDEIRKLDTGPGEATGVDPAGCTSCDTERAPGWDYDRRQPVRAFGFRSQR
jgi:hypothetical protein